MFVFFTAPATDSDVSRLTQENFVIPGPVLDAPSVADSIAPKPQTRKILIVDDNQLVAKTMAFKLKSKGYEICTALDGGEAVSVVRRERPDLILLDVNFPPDVAHGGGVPWDGFLILDWLRRLDEGRNIPVIFMSSGEYQERALAAGAVAFFQKPVNQESLNSVVERIFERAA